MAKITTTKNKLIKNKRNKQLLEILISLEKCNFTLNLTTRRPKETRSPLFLHEAPISMLFTIGSLYEALLGFDALKNEIISELLSKPNDNVKEMVDFINSTDVQDFKNKVLRTTRNRSSFHVDKRIISRYFADSDEEDEECLLWVEGDGELPHSPISSDILSWYFISMFKKLDFLDNTIFMADIHNKLRYITTYLMIEWYEVAVEQS